MHLKAHGVSATSSGTNHQLSFSVTSYRYAETALLYFGSNHEFSVVYATVIQGPTAEGVSRGDGRVVYLGTWKLEGAKLSVEYRLASRQCARTARKSPDRSNGRKSANRLTF